MMKKLFLILLVLLVGMAGLSAAPPRPGGVFTLDAALSENSVQEAVIISDTVLATQDFFSLPAGILALSDTIDFTGQPHGYMIKPMAVVSNETDYWLRL
ncbi:MAG: hypothetical protein LBI91_00385 [Spirochaetaceae bacterium]|jgi:hypothetical protein|nr:hypothetical protein [Spirochaetaceae bacterium]